MTSLLIFALDGSGNLFKVSDPDPLSDDLSGTLLTAPYTPYISAADNDGGNMFFGGMQFAPVPEPGSLSLLALSGVAALARRRGRKA